MKTNQLTRVEKMLEALLKSEGLIEWVGGWVGGQTSQGDSFIILYPASEHLKEKVCRVYPHQFKKLPAFINTDGIVGDTDNNPSKDKAQRAGIYHECPPFKIVMHLGKDTQMGREKRFGDVLYVPQRQSAPAGTEPGSVVEPMGSKSQTGDEKAAWRVKAANADEPFIFDTAMLELAPWYQNSGNVKKFREALFGEWKASHTESYVIGLEAYASQRMRLNGSLGTQEAHRRAKEHAMKALEEQVRK